MKKEILEKWNNTVIKVLSYSHGAKVIKFWESIGVDTRNWAGNQLQAYYGIFSGDFNNCYTPVKSITILTLEEAMAIRDKDKSKILPREMYCWDDDPLQAKKCTVIHIMPNGGLISNVMTIQNGNVYVGYNYCLDIEEYEKIYSKSLTKRLPTIEEVIKWFEENKIFYYDFGNTLVRIESINTWKKTIVINNTILSIENFCKRYTDQNGNELYITE